MLSGPGPASVSVGTENGGKHFGVKLPPDSVKKKKTLLMNDVYYSNCTHILFLKKETVPIIGSLKK